MNGPETVLIKRVDGLLKGRLALQNSASPWTVGHFDLTSFPVNVGVVVLQPRVSKDHLVPAEISYLGYYLFSVTLEFNDYFSAMVMSPAELHVPSTLYTGMGFSHGSNGIFLIRAHLRSMNTVLAPLSRRASILLKQRF